MKPRRDTAAPREPRLLLLAATAMLALTGCGVPGSGPATRLDKVEQDGAGGDAADEEALEPSTKEIITVRNFLGAAAGDVNGRDKRLAKFFESGDKQKWSQPSEGLQLVRIAPGGVESADDGDSYSAQVTVTGDIVGVYGQNGQVRPWSGDDEFKQTYELAREGARDVWHLTEAPRQVYLSDDHFANAYRMSPLYFPASSDQSGTLVPDARWLPKELIDSEARFNQLVDWLLGGPSDRISSTVSSAFPDGTSREKPVVSSGDGEKVTVDISADSASQPAKDHRTMGAQLAWTMGLTGDETLTLSVDGQDRLTADVGEWSSRLRTPEEDPDAESLAYYIHEDAVVADEPGAAFAGVEAAGLRQAAISPDGERIAAIAGGGKQRLLVGSGGELDRVKSFSSPLLADPQWLDDDTILLIDRGDPVTVDIDTGKRRELSIEEGAGEVSDLALSPDARRVAYIAGGRAWLSTVLPDEDANLKLGDPEAVAEEVSDIRDVDWSRETHLLMIGSVPDEKAWLWEASIDGAYLSPFEASEDVPRADALSVRCKPAVKNEDSPGAPILLEIEGIINWLYTEISPVQIDEADATGASPFTAA